MLVPHLWEQVRYDPYPLQKQKLSDNLGLLFYENKDHKWHIFINVEPKLDNLYFERLKMNVVLFGETKSIFNSYNINLVFLCYREV